MLSCVLLIASRSASSCFSLVLLLALALDLLLGLPTIHIFCSKMVVLIDIIMIHVIIVVVVIVLINHLVVDSLADLSLMMCRLEIIIIVIVCTLVIISCGKTTILVRFESHLFVPEVSSATMLVII